VNIDALLQPVAADRPGGPDLSYDPQRQVIEQAFETPADEVDWSRTVALIAAQAEQTRDAWLAVYWARAGAKGGDLGAVEDGVTLLAGLFERLWDSAHPTLDDYGVEGRKGACESLVRVGEFLAPLRRVPLIAHPRLGRFSGGDVERFAAEGAGADGYGVFRAAAADTSPELFVDVLAKLGRIEDAFRRADAVLSTQAEAAGHTGTNFQPTYEALDSMARALRQFSGATAAQPDAVTASVSPKPNDQPVGAVSGMISSRADVTRSLNAVIDYYARAEPSSPVPIAIERIKGWIEMDFVAILSDIAPGSLSEATNVLRTRREVDNGSELM